MILLTDEEIKQAKLENMNSEYPHLSTEAIRRKLALHSEDIAVANAQLKKVVEWGDETCTDRTHSGTMKRRECGFCWQSLLDEVKEHGSNKRIY